jgi:hypothetical protein
MRARYSIKQGPSLETAGMHSHCGFANGPGRLRGNSNSLLRGANFAWRLRPFAQIRFSLRAAGMGSGGYSTSLRPYPRASRKPSQATSCWTNVAGNNAGQEKTAARPKRQETILPSQNPSKLIYHFERIRRRDAFYKKVQSQEKSTRA